MAAMTLCQLATILFLVPSSLARKRERGTEFAGCRGNRLHGRQSFDLVVWLVWCGCSYSRILVLSNWPPGPSCFRGVRILSPFLLSIAANCYLALPLISLSLFTCSLQSLFTLTTHRIFRTSLSPPANKNVCRYDEWNERPGKTKQNNNNKSHNNKERGALKCALGILHG